MNWLVARKRLIQWVIAGPIFTLASGCIQTRITEPKRSAVEQLLISTAADQALEHLDASIISGKKTYVDSSYFESEDKQYVIGSVRDALSRSGALLTAKADDAEVIVEPRSGALSIDSSESLIGLPQIPIPVPLSGTLQTPELYLFKSQKQYSTAKLALLAYEQSSRKHVLSTGPLVGRADMKYYKFLGYFSLTRTSIPEKQAGRKKQSETAKP